MKSIISFMFILQAIINGVNLAATRTDMHACRGGDFKSNTIQKNRAFALDKLMALFKNSSHNGFQHTQVGDKPEEQVSVTFSCNPNAVKGLCECCLRKIIQYIPKHCPKQNEGVAWDFYPFLICMVHYSTGRKIFSVLDDWAWYQSKSADYVKAVNLEKTFDSLLSQLKEQAAGGDAVKKFALGSVLYDGDENALYMGVQCTPDLTKGDCIKCLSKARNEIRSCCTSKPLFSGRVISTNCFIWYSHISFFDSPISFNKEACG